MEKNVKVSLEAFGSKRLTVTLKPEEVKGKSVGDIVNTIINKQWQGEDKHALAIINRELSASGGYTPSVEFGGINLPVQTQPVRLGDKIERYIENYGQSEAKATLSVTGDHKVGYEG